MKNANLVLNIILLLAVGFLMVKQFQSPKTDKESTVVEEAEKGLHIVYVNADSVLAKYEDFKKSSDALAKREEDATKSLRAKQRSLENDFLAVQKKVQQGLLAPNQIADEEQRLAQKQQGIAQEQESVSRSLMDETQKLNEKLQKNVKEVLSALQKEKGYDYILSYGPGTGVLMVNDSLDITQMVVDRLNALKLEEEGSVESGQ